MRHLSLDIVTMVWQIDGEIEVKGYKFKQIQQIRLFVQSHNDDFINIYLSSISPRFAIL